MLRNSWLESVLVRTSATFSARSRKRPAFSPIRLEVLETRTAPAGLTFTGGAGLIGLPGVIPPQITSGTLNGGATAAEAEKIVEHAKSTGKFNGPNARSMQALWAY